MPVPAHVRALSLDDTTKATQEEAVWMHVLKELLDVPDDDDPIAVSLVHNGISSFHDFLVLTTREIDAFNYPGRPFPIGMIGRIKAIISLFNDWTVTSGAIIDLRTVSYEDFSDYRCSSYNTEHPLGVFQQQREQRFPVSAKASTSQACISHDTDLYSMDLYGFPRFDMNTIGPISDCTENVPTVPTIRTACIPADTTEPIPAIGYGQYTALPVPNTTVTSAVGTNMFPSTINHNHRHVHTNSRKERSDNRNFTSFANQSS